MSESLHMAGMRKRLVDLCVHDQTEHLRHLRLKKNLEVREPYCVFIISDKHLFSGTKEEEKAQLLEAYKFYTSAFFGVVQSKANAFGKQKGYGVEFLSSNQITKAERELYQIFSDCITPSEKYVPFLGVEKTRSGVTKHQISAIVSLMFRLNPNTFNFQVTPTIRLNHRPEYDSETPFNNHPNLTKLLEMKL